MKKIVILLILVTSAFANDAKFYETSFDCSNVKENSSEYKICSNKTLSADDLKLSNVLKSFVFVSNEIKKAQLIWMQERNTCKTTECIHVSYQKRIQSLKRASANQKSFPQEVLEFFEKADGMVQGGFEFLTKEHIQHLKEQKEVFFQFENMYYQKPLFENVKYETLKDVLGDCYKFKLNVYLNKFCEGSDCRYFFVDKSVQKNHDFYFTGWNVKVKGKTQLLLLRVDNKNSFYKIAYLLDKAQCSKVVKEPNFYYPNALHDKKIEWQEIVGQTLVGTLDKGEFHLLEFSKTTQNFYISLYPMYYKNKSFLTSAKVLTFINKNFEEK